MRITSTTPRTFKNTYREGRTANLPCLTPQTNQTDCVAPSRNDLFKKGLRVGGRLGVDTGVVAGIGLGVLSTVTRVTEAYSTLLGSRTQSNLNSLLLSLGIGAVTLMAAPAVGGLVGAGLGLSVGGAVGGIASCLPRGSASSESSRTETEAQTGNECKGVGDKVKSAAGISGTMTSNALAGTLAGVIPGLTGIGAVLVPLTMPLGCVVGAVGGGISGLKRHFTES